MSFRMVKILSTSGDLLRPKVKVKLQNFEVEYLQNGMR